MLNKLWNIIAEDPESGEDEESDTAGGDDAEASARDPEQSNSESDEAEELSTSGRLGDLLNRANGELGDGIRTIPVAGINHFTFWSVCRFSYLQPPTARKTYHYNKRSNN
jgi:hypothetical protein